MDSFISKFAKCQPCDILDTEFLVAQSLSFEFWVRGPEKALRGWALELQVCPLPVSRLITDGLVVTAWLRH